MQDWEGVERFLLDEAERDLTDGADIRPCLMAFDKEQALFVAFLRSLEKGRYDDAVVELLALAGPLNANRLALSIGARAWSLDDPVVPVVPGVGDLRQRVVMFLRADADFDVQTALHPFEINDDGVRWGEAVRHPGGEGWLTGALHLAVTRRADLAASPRDIRRQVRRCLALGHLLGLSETAERRMELRPRARR